MTDRPTASGEPSATATADRVLTVPNVISAARLLGVPVFLYLLLGPHADIAAFVVLILAGISDWADGVLARKLNQYSRIGELLDPAADRLYILATLIGLVLRDIIPWWLAAIIIGRDLVLAVALAVLRRYGWGPLPVHYLGKAATFNLLYAFPLLLLAARHNTFADICRPAAWAFTIWGTGLYLWAGGLYLLHTVQLVGSSRSDRHR
ncbi:MAG: CDP-alcohol phosphatidyltransferase family protein [Pseudonocardiales bacterium]|nr:CDP-alcohol phosphatidyltransferase family protein [Pseudonocardiales bacterium]